MFLCIGMVKRRGCCEKRVKVGCKNGGVEEKLCFVILVLQVLIGGSVSCV